VSSTHANPQGVKTDCPPNVLWDIMRCWVADHPVRPADPVTEPYLHKVGTPSFHLGFDNLSNVRSMFVSQVMIVRPADPVTEPYLHKVGLPCLPIGSLVILTQNPISTGWGFSVFLLAP
jgi:hypothetical protein